MDTSKAMPKLFSLGTSAVSILGEAPPDTPGILLSHKEFEELCSDTVLGPWVLLQPVYTAGALLAIQKPSKTPLPQGYPSTACGENFKKLYTSN